jgi:hypothetical protein
MSRSVGWLARSVKAWASAEVGDDMAVLKSGDVQWRRAGEGETLGRCYVSDEFGLK